MNALPNREVAIFSEALELEGSQRAAYLDEACAGDTALRQHLEALLRVHAKAMIFLETPALEAQASALEDEAIDATTSLSSSPAEKAGDMIGRYKVLQRIGEGGCGVVYMAEQEEPVRRRVALKVIKLGMDTKQVIARFEAERQALALMDHPNIAKVLDAGATETGRPYFVMELVRGVRITEFCDENQLPMRPRLELFILVCQAIQHAHQKGVIHRDIKPSNILVTVNDGVPVPKVIDFGIAKATTGQPLTDKTLFTAFEQFLGTPAYMSPEQAVMTSLDIDTRSDIYSLGVLLYELLTGSTPFDQKELLAAGLDEMRRTIREKEPPRPSTRLGRMAAGALTMTANHRQTEAPKLIHVVRGDLDWIVMKCLEKDRSRRYETANGLARDLERHLNCEPVVARPPSKLYEFQKTVRRHKFGFAATAAIVLVLAVGGGVSVWQAIRATRAERSQSHLREMAQQAEAKEIRLRRDADAARQRENQLRQLAEAQAYSSDMRLAQQALAENRTGVAQNLLDRRRPKAGEPDLRGWEWRYLWQFCQSDAESALCQRPNPIWSVAVSHDGQWLAVGEFEGGGLSVWDLHTRQERWRLTAGDGRVHVAFSPVAPLLAYSALAGPYTNRLCKVTLRQVATDRDLFEFQLGGECVGLALSGDGQTLVTSTAARENQIALWRVADGQKLSSYPAPQSVTELGVPFAVAPDLSVAAYGVRDVHLIDLATGKERWQAKAATNVLVALAFSPDGRILASSAGHFESSIRLWDVSSGRELAQLEGHRDWVGRMVFLPDGKTLVSTSRDETIRLWDLSQITNVPPPYVLRGSHGISLALALLPGSTKLVCGGEDASVYVWDTANRRSDRSSFILPVKPGPLWQFEPDSQSVLTVAGGRVARWTGPRFERMEPLIDVGKGSRYLFSKDAQFLAGVAEDKSVQVWDLRQRVQRRQIRSPGSPRPAAFSAKGSRLVIADLHGDVLHEWDLATQQRTRSWRSFAVLPGEETVVSLSPDERWCLSLGYRGSSLLYDLTADRETDPHLGLRRAITAAFSPGGKFLAAVSMREARLWEATSLRDLGTLRGGGASCGFSPNGQRLAIGHGDDRVISLWNVENQQEVLTIPTQAPYLQSCAFSPDGNLLGASDWLGGLQFWRAPSWAEIEAAEKAERR